MSIGSKLSALALAIALLLGPLPATSAVFLIEYDDSESGAIDGSIVGTGVLSYDGAPTAGFFGLDTLTGLSYSATFVGGQSFTLADLLSPLTDAGIFVTDLGGGDFSLVFAGFGSVNDFLDPGTADILTHEPTDPFGVGCCGGDGIVNLYALVPDEEPFFVSGDYSASLLVPEPWTPGLIGLGLVGLGFVRRRTSV